MHDVYIMPKAVFRGPLFLAYTSMNYATVVSCMQVDSVVGWYVAAAVRQSAVVQISVDPEVTSARAHCSGPRRDLDYCYPKPHPEIRTGPAINANQFNTNYLMCWLTVL